MPSAKSEVSGRTEWAGGPRPRLSICKSQGLERAEGLTGMKKAIVEQHEDTVRSGPEEEGPEVGNQDMHSL